MLLLMGSIVLTNLPGYKHQKAVFVLFIVSGKEQREAGWQMEEYIKSSRAFSPPAGRLLLAVLCRVLAGEGYSQA